MFFSASQLVKSSAKQILYLRDKPKAAPTLRMKEGDAYATSVITSHLVEMQSKFTHRDLDIWFTVDEIREKGHRAYLMEHKMVTEGELWFFHSSVMQCAFYGAMALYVDQFKTAKWAAGESYEFTPHDHMYSVLNFGGQQYRITFNAKEVLRFYLTKARASLSYSTAARFDGTWKRREWDYLKEFIRFRLSKNV